MKMVDKIEKAENVLEFQNRIEEAKLLNEGSDKIFVETPQHILDLMFVKVWDDKIGYLNYKGVYIVKEGTTDQIDTLLNLSHEERAHGKHAIGINVT